MGKNCPVCTRPVKSENPQKGDLAWEDTYCSTYCRLYDERGLEKVPFEGGNKHHKNKNANTRRLLQGKGVVLRNPINLQVKVEMGGGNPGDLGAKMIPS